MLASSEPTTNTNNELQTTRNICIKGLFPERDSLPIYTTTNELLRSKPELKQAMEHPIKYTENDRHEIILEGNLEPLHSDTFAYYKENALPGDQIEIITYLGEPKLLLKRELNHSTHLAIVMDLNRIYREEYRAFLARKRTNQLTFDEKMLGYNGPKFTDSTTIHHLIRFNPSSKATIDYKDLFPPNWKFQKEDQSTGGTEDQFHDAFNQDSDELLVGIPDIKNTSDLLKLGHEYGHSVNDAADPTTFRQTKDLWQKSGQGDSRLNSLTVAEMHQFGPMLSHSERGASAVALVFEQECRRHGLDLGLESTAMSQILNRPLENYQKHYGGALHFKFTQSNGIST